MNNWDISIGISCNFPKCCRTILQEAPNIIVSKSALLQVTDGNTTSRTFNFTTAPAVGSFPMKMGVYADVGQTYNSSITLQRLLDAGSSVLAFIGDWSYADDYTTSGQCLVIGFPVSDQFFAIFTVIPRPLRIATNVAGKP